MVWLNVFLTSNALDRQMEEMVLGEDYDREDVVITDKRSEDASADNDISQNYFFYYHGGKRMNIISGCRCRKVYIQNMRWEIP